MSYDAFIHGLSEILVKQGVLTKQRAGEVEQAFHESPSDNFDEFLIEEGFVEPDELLRALSAYYNVPSFEAEGYFFDQTLVRDFPKDVLLRHAAIPLRLDGDILVVVAANPAEHDLETILRRYTNNDIIFFVGLRRSICDAVKEFYDESLMEEEQDEDLREEFELDREFIEEAQSDDED